MVRDQLTGRRIGKGAVGEQPEAGGAAATHPGEQTTGPRGQRRADLAAFEIEPEVTEPFTS